MNESRLPLRQRVLTFVAPWAEIAYLRRELHGAKSSCSAEAKRANRLTARIKVLERKLAKRIAQHEHDQAYIDALEARLTQASVRTARAEIPGRRAGMTAAELEADVARQAREALGA